MNDDRAARRYRRLYARLLRLYPEAFRSRFAESMEQTFHDLCREHDAGRGLFKFALGLFAETFAGILKERIVVIMPPRRNLFRLLLLTACVLLVPLVGMRVGAGVDWSPFDFLAAGTLLFGAGFAFEVIAWKSGNAAYRTATGLACAAALLLIWVNLAVGVIGSEDNPANMLFLGVLTVAGVGAALSRLRPLGMAQAMFAAAATQAAVPLLAVWIWKPFGGEETLAELIRVMFLNLFFVLLFVGSAVLFRRAGAAPHRSGPGRSSSPVDHPARFM